MTLFDIQTFVVLHYNRVILQKSENIVKEILHLVKFDSLQDFHMWIILSGSIFFLTICFSISSGHEKVRFLTICFSAESFYQWLNSFLTSSF